VLEDADGKSLLHAIAQAEHSMRGELEAHVKKGIAIGLLGGFPEPVLPEPPIEEPKKVPTIPRVVPAVPAVLPKLSFSGAGDLFSDDVSEAHNLGVRQGTFIKVGEGSDIGKGKIGQVEEVTQQGCAVMFSGEIDPTMVPTKHITVLSKEAIKEHQKKMAALKKDESQQKPEVELPHGLPFVLASRGQTAHCLLSWAQAALWKLTVSCATGANNPPSGANSSPSGANNPSSGGLVLVPSTVGDIAKVVAARDSGRPCKSAYSHLLVFGPLFLRE